MNRTLALTLCVIAALGLQGCKEELPHKQKANTPSPLTQLEEARRWVLMESGYGFNPRCEKLYRHPDDTRFQSSARICAEWEDNTVEYLTMNGVAGIEAAHLREHSLWDWRKNYLQKASDCRKEAWKSKGNDKLKFAKCNAWDKEKELHKHKVREVLGLTQRPKGGALGSDNQLDLTPLNFERND